MSTEQTLLQRSNSKCELCSNEENLSVYKLPPENQETAEQSILVCTTCLEQITQTSPIDESHWRCLNDSMWSTTPAVQIMAWRLLKALSSSSWAQDLLEMLYLDPEMQTWAESASIDITANESSAATLDSNGSQLLDGDTVTLIKDLDVKGAGFTAKRGTVVKNISLTDNPKHIEGRANGVRIVLVANFLKKVV
ncbi:MAG: PhnA domain-containing protein [Methyloprofundus sp.]|nr:PhnA domain-containing protein [Methyloprofundus sp.]